MPRFNQTNTDYDNYGVHKVSVNGLHIFKLKDLHPFSIDRYKNDFVSFYKRVKFPERQGIDYNNHFNEICNISQKRQILPEYTVRFDSKQKNFDKVFFTEPYFYRHKEEIIIEEYQIIFFFLIKEKTLFNDEIIPLVVYQSQSKIVWKVSTYLEKKGQSFGKGEGFSADLYTTLNFALLALFHSNLKNKCTDSQYKNYGFLNNEEEIKNFSNDIYNFAKLICDESISRFYSKIKKQQLESSLLNFNYIVDKSLLIKNNNFNSLTNFLNNLQDQNDLLLYCNSVHLKNATETDIIVKNFNSISRLHPIFNLFSNWYNLPNLENINKNVINYKNDFYRIKILKFFNIPHSHFSIYFVKSWNNSIEYLFLSIEVPEVKNVRPRSYSNEYQHTKGYKNYFFLLSASYSDNNISSYLVNENAFSLGYAHCPPISRMGNHPFYAADDPSEGLPLFFSCEGNEISRSHWLDEFNHLDLPIYFKDNANLMIEFKKQGFYVPAYYSFCLPLNVYTTYWPRSKNKKRMSQ